MSKNAKTIFAVIGALPFAFALFVVLCVAVGRAAPTSQKAAAKADFSDGSERRLDLSAVPPTTVRPTTVRPSEREDFLNALKRRQPAARANSDVERSAIDAADATCEIRMADRSRFIASLPREQRDLASSIFAAADETDYCDRSTTI